MTRRLPAIQHRAACAAVAIAVATASCAPTAPAPPAGTPVDYATDAVPSSQLSTTLAPTDATTTTIAGDPTSPAPPDLPTGAAPPTLADLGITAATPDTFDAVSIFGVRDPSSGEALWVAYTTGARSFEPFTPHAIAILRHDAGAWHVIERMALGIEAGPDAAATPDPGGYFGPDHLSPDSVAQVAIEPTRLWLTVDGHVGAHGGSFAVLSFDGRQLRLETHASNSMPGIGRVEDLDGDGIGEVVIDQTDAYVFCYACGVREASVGVLKWDGDRLQSIVLQPTSDADEVRYALDAVSGGFWQTATDLAQLALQPQEPTRASDAVPRSHQDILNDQEVLLNNRIVIQANYEARASLTGADNPYPVLHHIFVGDWLGAVEPLRTHTPERLFSPDSPLVVGTPAEGNVPALAERIGIAAGSALNYGPKLEGAPTDFQWNPAPAHFLRGWSAWLATPGDPAARADIAKAAELAPDDTLFTSSAAWIAAHP